MGNVIDVREYQPVYDLKNWKKTWKKHYEVYVCMPAIGTKLSNFLEGSSYITSDKKPFVLSGTVGETWVIDGAKLSKTYVMMDDSEINEETFNKKVVNVNGSPVVDWFKIKTRTGANIAYNYALFVPSHIQLAVPTSWGDILYVNRPGINHGQGDFLVCADNGGVPNLNDMWVVNGLVFPTTYSMTGFKNFGANTDSFETPQPKSIVPTNLNKVVNNTDNTEKVTKEISRMLYVYYKEQFNLENCDTYMTINGSELGVAVMVNNGVLNIEVVRYDEDEESWEECGSFQYKGKFDYRKIIQDIVLAKKK